MSIFKAYDIRGVYPDEISEKDAKAIAGAFVAYLGAKRILLGRDMRTHSPSLAEAAVEGALAAGADVVDVGLITTPMSYFGVGRLGLDGGLMVTASHNPGKYNGFKLCREGAGPISGEKGLPEIEALSKTGVPVAAKRGTRTTRDLKTDYVAHVAGLAGKGRALSVAVDGGNGMGGPFALEILHRLGHEYEALYCDPDGRFPNHEANPLKAETLRDLQAVVRRNGAAFGVAFDGDADRAIFVDETGEPVPNDLFTALLAPVVLKAHPGAVIVYDLRSTWAVREEISKAGGVPVRERVGHSFIKATMRARKSPFGGELSGHTYWAENYTADSAMIAMVRLIGLLQHASKPLSGLVAPLRRYFSTGEVNFVVADKDAKIREVEKVFADGRIDFLDGITVEYPDWWFNVRKSNTEPLLRLCLEAKTAEGKEKGLKRVLAVLGEPEKTAHA